MLKRKNIMWIDDEAKSLASYAEAFESKGIAIKFISTCIRAIHLLEKMKEESDFPDIILLDIMMPNTKYIFIDGKKIATNGGHDAGLVFYNIWLKGFIEKTRKSHKEIVVIALTNLQRTDKKLDEVKNSGLPFLIKNYSVITRHIPNIILEQSVRP